MISIERYIIMILFIVCIIFVIFVMLSHAPIFKISNKKISKIKHYGLLHFTSVENAKSIIETQKLIGQESNMRGIEKKLGKMIWFYDNEPNNLQRKHEVLLKKAKARNQQGAYDVCLLITNLDDNSLNKFYTRKGIYKDSPSVYKGDQLNDVKISMYYKW